MKEIVKIYIKTLTNKNYSQRTIDTYVCYLEKFLAEVKTNPYHISTKQIKTYLINKKYTSVAQQNQIIGSLKLFAKYILHKKAIHLDKIERPRKLKKLPRVINAELLASKINAVKNLKHRAILTLGLSCGLRVSEVIQLKWIHLNRKDNLLFVANGKGKKERYVYLNDNLIALLDQYWLQYRSEIYVFNGQFKKTYAATSIQKIVKKYIGPGESFHLLRHSYATFALDNETSIRLLANSLGHNSVKTTEIYNHTSFKNVAKVKQAI